MAGAVGVTFLVDVRWLSWTKKESMKKQIGLWIDHRETVIVAITDQGEETRRIASGMEKHVRFSDGSGSEDGSAEDQRDTQFTDHLNGYYGKVISNIRDAESILIFGPGEARGELEKHLESKRLDQRIVSVETVDTMTDRQISAKVRQHFQKYACPFENKYEATPWPDWLELRVARQCS